MKKTIEKPGKGLPTEPTYPIDKGIQRERGSTERVKNLLADMYVRCFEDRRQEWFTGEMFENIFDTDIPLETERAVATGPEDYFPTEEFVQKTITDPWGNEVEVRDESVIVRRAIAFKAMLEAMSNPEHNHRTHTFEIRKGELIVGTTAISSLGLGKVFPNYLTNEEKEIAFSRNKGGESMLAHNSTDYPRVLDGGLEKILNFCAERIENLKYDVDAPMGKNSGAARKIDFYRAVEICCNAVVEYAHKFGELAEKEAELTDDKDRRDELLEIARICYKVPLKPADTFHEALQSIWFVHNALQSTTNHVSIGRLDQLLDKYYQKMPGTPEEKSKKAIELLECFWIKGAERLILNTENLVEMDHQDFSTGMGTNPYLLDQKVSINQFMQNVVIGGQTRDGRDASNDCTYLILDAVASVGLPTPVLNFRLHKGSSPELKQKVAHAMLNSSAGQPILFNDEVIVPALTQKEHEGCKTIPKEEALDYVIDGCWEPILNGKSDFNYTMLGMLEVLECALNGGAGISNQKIYLRGPKKSFYSRYGDEIKSFEELQDIFEIHLRYYTTREALKMYSIYLLDGSTCPAPFFSAMLGNCLEKGIDKSWGGADYTLSGVVYYGAPNAVNALAAIKKYVFDEKKYKMSEVVEALRVNYKGYDEMKKEFLNVPKFGNNISEINELMKWMTDISIKAVRHGEDLAEKVFVRIPETPEEAAEYKRLRKMAGYTGVPMREHFGKDFHIRFAGGFGTFAQYDFLGSFSAASADGRPAFYRVASNFSPTSGTATTGAGSTIAELKGLDLERFAMGVMTDIYFDYNFINEDFLVSVMDQFCENDGSITAITISKSEDLKKVYEISNKVRNGELPVSALFPYNDISVRLGGWNGPFVALTQQQQYDYLQRADATFEAHHKEFDIPSEN